MSQNQAFVPVSNITAEVDQKALAAEGLSFTPWRMAGNPVIEVTCTMRAAQGAYKSSRKFTLGAWVELCALGVIDESSVFAQRINDGFRDTNRKIQSGELEVNPLNPGDRNRSGFGDQRTPSAQDADNRERYPKGEYGSGDVDETAVDGDAIPRGRLVQVDQVAACAVADCANPGTHGVQTQNGEKRVCDDHLSTILGTQK